MKFGSWTYNGFKVNFMLQQEAGDISGFIPNGEWKLLGKLACWVIVDLVSKAEPSPALLLDCFDFTYL